MLRCIGGPEICVRTVQNGRNDILQGFSTDDETSGGRVNRPPDRPRVKLGCGGEAIAWSSDMDSIAADGADGASAMIGESYAYGPRYR
jgi:hypothetical protein